MIDFPVFHACLPERNILFQTCHWNENLLRVWQADACSNSDLGSLLSRFCWSAWRWLLCTLWAGRSCALNLPLAAYDEVGHLVANCLKDYQLPHIDALTDVMCYFYFPCDCRLLSPFDVDLSPRHTTLRKREKAGVICLVVLPGP